MKGTSIIFCLLLLLFNNSVKSQSAFTFVYGNNTFENKSVNGISDNEGNIYILGVRNAFDANAVGSPIEGYPVLGFSIIKLNSNGLKLWDVFKSLPMIDGSRLPTSNLIINRNRIYISYIKPMGWKECGNNVFSEYDNRGLLCIDTAGFIIFDSLYNNNTCSKYRELSLSYFRNQILSVYKEENKIRAITTNFNGQTILDTSFNFNFTISAVLSQNTGLLVFGSQPQLKKIFISSIDSNFNTNFIREINTQYFPEIYLTTKKDDRNNIIILNGKELILISNEALLKWSILLPYRCHALIQISNNRYQTFSNIDSNDVPIVVSYVLSLQGEILDLSVLAKSNYMTLRNVIKSASQHVYLSDTSCCYSSPGIATKIHVSNSINTTLGQEVSKKKVNELDIRVFNNKLVIISDKEEKQNYMLVNMNGKRILSGFLKFGENTVLTSGLSSGFYLFLTPNYSYKIYIP